MTVVRKEQSCVGCTNVGTGTIFLNPTGKYQRRRKDTLHSSCFA
jgi:hypothetical protein